MDNIICPECKTENEPQYVYCKNCGKKLIDDSEKTYTDYNKANYSSKATYAQNNQPYATQGAYAQNGSAYDATQIVENIDSLPVDDIATYVGKKAHNILPKLSRMEITGSKTSWCWPAAVLGYLFGPLGAAIWFFYRKMYKVAFILVAIGLVLTTATSLLSGDIAAIEGGVTQQIESGTFDVYEFLESFEQTESLQAQISVFVENISCIVTMVLCGLFSYNIYKKHIVKSIEKYRERNIDPRYYHMGLAAIGGTSGGMAVLGVVIMSFITELCTIIATLVF